MVESLVVNTGPERWDFYGEMVADFAIDYVTHKNSHVADGSTSVPQM